MDRNRNGNLHGCGNLNLTYANTRNFLIHAYKLPCPTRCSHKHVRGKSALTGRRAIGPTQFSIARTVWIAVAHGFKQLTLDPSMPRASTKLEPILGPCCYASRTSFGRRAFTCWFVPCKGNNGNLTNKHDKQFPIPHFFLQFTSKLMLASSVFIWATFAPSSGRCISDLAGQEHKSASRIHWTHSLSEDLSFNSTHAFATE